MRDDAKRRVLVVSGEWPRRLECGGARNLSLSLSAGSHAHGRTVTEFGRRVASPLFVPVAPLLTTVFREAFAAAYYARVELPKDYLGSQPWPRWYKTVRQISEFVDWLRKAVGDHHQSGPGSIYPVKIWLLPGGNSRVENLADLFRLLPFDDGVHDEIFAEGAVRISIALTYGDVIAENSMRSKCSLGSL